MTRIRINDEAMRAIMGVAENEFRQTGRKAPDGLWDVPVEQDTLDRILQHRMPDESMSDTIIRVIACAAHGPH